MVNVPIKFKWWPRHRLCNEGARVQARTYSRHKKHREADLTTRHNTFSKRYGALDVDLRLKQSLKKTKRKEGHKASRDEKESHNRSIMLSDLPTEILTDIFQHCDPVVITETCRQFATIVHTTPSFWSSVNLRSSQFVSEGNKYLHQRLQRAGISPLRLSIGPIYSNDISLPVVTEICQTLAEFNSRVQLLEITTETSLLAGMILSGIFSTLIVFPTLESLSILVEDDPDDYISKWPHLNVVLERAIEWFPMLQTLGINTFQDCIPVFPERSSFAHLHTLILDGTLEQGAAYMGSIVALLHCTPRLETLWLKHFTREQNVNLTALYAKGEKIHLPVPHPCLNSLSIAVPGCGADIIRCIDVPALREVHIDGSREFIYGETEHDDGFWSDWDARSVLGSLKHLANGSQHLRRLAITSTYLTAAGWQWLLFGEGQGCPFPQLESLALHGIDESSGEISCGFNDDLLVRYSQEPSICLSKLTLLRCRFPLSGTALVRAIKAKPFELVFDGSCPQFSADELHTLVDLKVNLCQRQEWEVKEDEWWNRGHQIDASDSHVY